MIRLEHIDKTYNIGTVNETHLFSDFHLSVEEGEFVSVVGSNGSGKTTLLNILAGSIPVEGGRVFLGDTDLTAAPEYVRSRRIGRVYQDPKVGTVPNMTIMENLFLAENKGKPFGLQPLFSRGKKKHFRELLARLSLGLEDKGEVFVGSLSGGQRQALSLLMTTLTPVDLLLLDEHTAALDPKTAEIIMHLTDEIVREKHITAFMVTHNLRYAVEYGTRLLMMDKGKIVLDVSGEEKKNLKVDDLLDLFNRISIECGN